MDSGASPVSCKWVKPQGPPRGFDFDVTKAEQIFDLLLKEKQLKVPEGHKIPTAQELNGKPYCKWHNTFTHATNDWVWRQQIQMAIEQGRLIFSQYAMKVDTHPFPAVNMVECTYPGRCQPSFSFNINMVGPGHHSGKDGDEGSCSHNEDKEEAVPRDRLRHDGKRYITEGEVKNPVNKMLVDTGAAVNIMPYSMLRRLGRSSSDLIKTNVTLSDFNGQASDAQGVLNVDLTVGRKTIPTTFFIVDRKSTYAVLLGRDWIHANCCIPSTMHQCLIQWDGDEVEVVHADDSAEISTAGMNVWETTGQEPLSGINLDDCERIDVTKDGVRLVLSTGLTV
ncbi:hypothetical protein QYE76_067239 [Lolium multiflorum]|uniref:Peptidase A2 domain-containing protein n=1 Tax=Lolium multiflorum TaxID=4521 RepID=A0AAD8SCX6_LOLMU|nr:hypothetical protein QYE76_067239 [Lolium multiflorum]